LGLIVSDTAYSRNAPPTSKAPPFWVSPKALGRASATMDGTTAQISAASLVWEEDVQTLDMYLNPASFEEANQWSLPACVLGDLK
jgi:hypothetical protein